MTDELAYRVALAVLLLTGFGASGRMRRRADRLRGGVPRTEDPDRIGAWLRTTGARPQPGALT